MHCLSYGGHANQPIVDIKTLRMTSIPVPPGLGLRLGASGRYPRQLSWLDCDFSAMQNVIRISPTVTLRLTPRAVTGSQKPRSKLKPKSRQVLTGITNLVVPRASENDDTSNNIVSSSKTPTRRASCDVRVPGPFLRIRHVQKGCLSEVIAVRDMNGGRKLRGRVLCLKRFVKTEVAENRAHRIILQELQAYKAMGLAGKKWLPFVMRLDASLEDAFCLYFAMVRSLENVDSLLTYTTHRILWIVIC
jgi:hypothetical protein